MSEAEKNAPVPHFAIVVAMDEAGGIGKDGDLPWKLSADMAHFRELTIGGGNNAVIMGRRTWESIPDKFRPLPQRHNIVLTRAATMNLADGVDVSNSLDRALALAPDYDDIFVIGGGALYTEAARHPACRSIFMTAIHATFDCDTFFLPDESQWELESDTPPQEEDGVQFSFCIYNRKPCTKTNPN